MIYCATMIGQSFKRQADFRERKRHGLRMVRVPVDAHMVSLLVALRFLDEADTANPAMIGKAIAILLITVARHHERTAQEIELSQQVLQSQSRLFRKPRAYRKKSTY